MCGSSHKLISQSLWPAWPRAGCSSQQASKSASASLSWTHRLKVLHSQLGIVGFCKRHLGIKGPLHTQAKSRDHEIVRAQKKSVQRPSQHTLQNHVVWSRTTKSCTGKSYVTGSSTKCYFDEFLFTRVFMDNKRE